VCKSSCRRTSGEPPQRSRDAHPVAGFVENILAWADRIAQILGHLLRNLGRAGVETVDDEGLHRDDLIRSLEPILIEPELCSLFVCVERRHQFPPLVASDWAHGKIAAGVCDFTAAIRWLEGQRQGPFLKFPKPLKLPGYRKAAGDDVRNRSPQPDSIVTA
jgi:hypothetical protein